MNSFVSVIIHSPLMNVSVRSNFRSWLNFYIKLRCKQVGWNGHQNPFLTECLHHMIKAMAVQCKSGSSLNLIIYYYYCFYIGPCIFVTLLEFNFIGPIFNWPNETWPFNKFSSKLIKSPILFWCLCYMTSVNEW